MNNILNTHLKRLQSSVSNWLGLETLLENEVSKLCNSMNEMTHIQSDNVNQMFGDLLMPSRIISPAQNKLVEKFSILKDICNQMKNDMENMKFSYDAIFNEKTSKNNDNMKPYDGDVELSSLNSIINQIEQQTILEICIIDNIQNKINREWSVANDQNELITLLACFQYKPYLDETLFKKFISLKM